MLRCLTSRQVSELIAYNSLEPIGYWTEWARTGQVCSVLANIHGKKGGRTFEPKDFMPDLPASDEEVKEQSLAQMKSAVLSIAAWAKKAGRLKGQKGIRPPVVRRRDDG